MFIATINEKKDAISFKKSKETHMRLLGGEREGVNDVTLLISKIKGQMMS